MSDARWVDVMADAQDASTHFGFAVQTFEAGGFGGETLEAYRSRMAFMHAMQAGHTSFEAALLRIFAVLGEQRPSGDQWHRDLIARAARPMEGENGRPPILTRLLAAEADETRRFRNLATRSYGSFDPGKAAPAVAAARELAIAILPAVAAFRDAVDPAR